MSLYTHWACFDCRKSFSYPLNDNGRLCGDCGQPVVDMGKYFKPPRRHAKRAWEVMRVLAQAGYRFATEGSQVFIERLLLPAKNPSIAEATRVIVAGKLGIEQHKIQSRMAWHKEDKARGKRKGGVSFI